MILLKINPTFGSQNSRARCFQPSKQMNVNKHILIVDDDYVYKLVTRRMINLCCSNAEIILAENGREAIDILQAAIYDPSLQLPDIILLDIEMPEMNGWEFLNAFSSLAPAKLKGIRIYVVSSSIDDVDRERTSVFPAVKELLVKPFSIAKMAGIINYEASS
ncbi:response regulator [Niabella hibiscisoli]|uniref:response regulator n=1 Tax=Niabella hibiscisoli TaxID=1825928 RepID=UPI001F10797B|nr:response regulator [Niabella hibiscisoli]MCH5719587.1 response regulator [Niabella hibiscisoli]